MEEQERPQPTPQCAQTFVPVRRHHNVNCLVLDACTICSTVRCWGQQHYLCDFFHNLRSRDDGNVLHLETIHELFLYTANARGTNRIMSISFKISHQHVHKMFRKSRASQQCKRAIATPRQQRHGVSRRAGSNFSDLRSLNLLWRSVIFFSWTLPSVFLGANLLLDGGVLCNEGRAHLLCDSEARIARATRHATPLQNSVL